MKSTRKLLLIFFLCWHFPGLVAAQQQPKLAAADSVAGGSSFSWKPTAVRLGVDVSRLVSRVLEPADRIYEANADLQFGRYFLTADFGAGAQEHGADQLNYQIEGSFFRLGADINLIPENKDNNVLFVGFRYGRSYYNEQLSALYPDLVFGSFPLVVDRDVSARWFEGVAGMKARVWKGLFLGYTLRYKLGLKAHDKGSFETYQVPGFGKVGDGNTFAFNYHIFYRIPFK